MVSYVARSVCTKIEYNKLRRKNQYSYFCLNKSDDILFIQRWLIENFILFCWTIANDIVYIYIYVYMFLFICITRSAARLILYNWIYLSTSIFRTHKPVYTDIHSIGVYILVPSHYQINAIIY